MSAPKIVFPHNSTGQKILPKITSPHRNCPIFILHPDSCNSLRCLLHRYICETLGTVLLPSRQLETTLYHWLVSTPLVPSSGACPGSQNGVTYANLHPSWTTLNHQKVVNHQLAGPGGLFSHPVLKNMSQLGWWKQPNINGKIENGNQTTNQLVNNIFKSGFATNTNPQSFDRAAREVLRKYDCNPYVRSRYTYNNQEMETWLTITRLHSSPFW